VEREEKREDEAEMQKAQYSRFPSLGRYTGETEMNEQNRNNSTKNQRIATLMLLYASMWADGRRSYATREAITSPVLWWWFEVGVCYCAQYGMKSRGSSTSSQRWLS